MAALKLTLAFLACTALVAPVSVQAIHKEIFTTNAVCRQNFCVNPVFPGLEDLYSLSQQQFQCETLKNVAANLAFCADAVNYDPALPRPSSDSGEAASLADQVREMEQRAMTTYVFHLQAMGLESWDHTKPWDGSNTCVESAWRLACYTYFPRAAVGCTPGQTVNYVAPCQSSCHSFVKSCGVECCDESVQCTFEHTKKLDANTTITTRGYEPHDGPSAFCTGSASRSGKFSSLLLLGMSAMVGVSSGALSLSSAPVAVMGLLGFAALASGAVTTGADAVAMKPVQSAKLELVQTSAKTEAAAKAQTAMTTEVAAKAKTGTAAKAGPIPEHHVGNWRGKKDYLLEFQFVPPGETSAGAILNSCSLSNLAQTLQCSGRGLCKPLDPSNLANPISFCECDAAWADPECRTRRKSQAVAYVLSLFLGFLGADQFYLGFPVRGAVKLVSFGGLGVWWVVDVVYIGSSPVYAGQYRVAPNLPHWAFVLTVVVAAAIVGFASVGVSTVNHISRKRKGAMLLHAEEEAAFNRSVKLHNNGGGDIGVGGGYAAPTPMYG